MGKVWVLLSLWVIPAYGQGLFESSLSGDQNENSSSSLNLGGFIRSVAYLGLTPEEELLYLQSAYTQVGLMMNAKSGAWTHAKADIRFRYGNEFQKELTEWEIREAYVDLTRGAAGLRMGKLISPWGKGTLFNPTDKVTPNNLTVRSPDTEDFQIGSWGVQGSVSLGSYMKITGIWKPLYQASKLLIEPVLLPEYIKFQKSGFPGPEWKEGSYGLRYDLHLPLLDASLYWFSGYDPWVGIRFESFTIDSLSMEPLALNLREQAYGIRMAGVDLSLPVGSWILRMEGAWQRTIDVHDEPEYLPLPELAYTAEIERSGSHVTLLAGYYGKYILDYSPPSAAPSLSLDQEQFLDLIQKGLLLTPDVLENAVREQIGAFNRLYNYQLEEFHHAAFFVIDGHLWQNRLEVTFPVIFHYTTEEWVFQPGISFLPSDGIRISAGYSGLYGPENSLYDLAGPVLNAGYLSIKITF